MASLEDKTGRQLINKVPEVTLYFWIIKIMATTVGETAADYLNVNLGFGLSVTSWVMAGLLAVALLFQISKKSYEPWIYWLTVVLISVVGTLITDNLVDNLGVSLETTTIAFSIALALTFLAWFASEKTLSIHTIFTKRRELFYWLTILFTFALGTAGGDLASEGLAWGYMQSALIFGGLIALVTFCFYFLRLNAIFAFWVAYILTRPLGASLGDLMSQPVGDGGMGIGTFGINAVFLTVIVALVAFLTVTRKDREVLES
jgi:uncharacterized membrane-anchored protein|tara:strand:- start:3976 stop:4755 length:780 start_codon:yes stop_codon:yes gene_type:complete